MNKRTLINIDRTKRVLLMVVGLILNVLFSFGAHSLKLPLYFDTIGTVIVSSLLWPSSGILVAVLTGCVSYFFNHDAFYYLVINVLIALFVCVYRRREQVNSIKNVVLLVLELGTISGIMIPLIEWFVLKKISNPTVEFTVGILHSYTKIPTFIIFLILNILLNIVDKLIAVALAFLVVHFIPRSKREELDNNPWRQTPLSYSDKEEFRKDKGDFGNSIKTRIMTMAIFVAVLLMIVMEFIAVKIVFTDISFRLTSPSRVINLILRTALIIASFLIFIIVGVSEATDIYILYPLKSMTRSMEGFIKGGDDQKALDNNVKEIRNVNLSTDDELERLYQTLCEMALNMAEQMRAMRHYSDATSKMQNGLIITMADLVENRDSDTGAHIQKTAAYVKIIVEGLKKKGYYSEKLTPEFMNNCIISAPLHDIGKINIPDAVLNKPGKLTPEEYEIIKTHTVAGKQIMEKAINTVGGENYLKEARNMAAYHHERWDGKGYPEGLHGQVIPLSARIMSVADVFDALTSPRVYKPAFSFEKALDIITEGAGTQFDPKVVEVFMDSLPEVKVVLRKYNE